MRTIYLDYTAHMPVCSQALKTLMEAEMLSPGNANSRHRAGASANRLMEKALLNVAGLLKIQPKEVIFTSGASESNNTAIQGIIYASRHFGRHIITTPLEHPSVSGCLTALQERGYEIDVLPLKASGQIDLDALKCLLRQDTVLVTLCAVDSELGTVQPVEQVAELIKAFPHCHLHMDATQAVGKIPVSFSCAHTASLSAHKFGGITGSGLLYKKSETEMEPLIHGGISTSLYRSGSPAVGLAASLSAALEDALTALDDRYQMVQTMNRYLRSELLKRNVRIHSSMEAIPHILNVGIDGIKGHVMRDRLDTHGVCISVKSACSVDSTPSRAVYAVTGNRRQALESWRISLSHLTDMEELEEFLEILDFILKEETK